MRLLDGDGQTSVSKEPPQRNCAGEEQKTRAWAGCVLVTSTPARSPDPEGSEG